MRGPAGFHMKLANGRRLAAAARRSVRFDLQSRGRMTPVERCRRRERLFLENPIQAKGSSILSPISFARILNGLRMCGISWGLFNRLGNRGVVFAGYFLPRIERQTAMRLATQALHDMKFA